MNAPQIHLALTHVPVILSLAGFVLLLTAFLRKNDMMKRIALYALLIAGMIAIPVYLTGEGTEEAVEHLPGVSEGIIDQHASFAGIAFFIIGLGGLMSLAGLAFSKRHQLARVLQVSALILAFGSAATMAWTAHLGGQIRHTEIRTAFAAASDNQDGNKEAPGNETGKGETDND